MRAMIFGLLLFLCASQVRAEMKVKEYLSTISSSDTVKAATTKLYVRGLGEGIDWANSATVAPTYCPPEKLALGVDNYVSIINRRIKTLADKLTKSQLDESWIGQILMEGLQETFPCARK
jgi:hypothetical protein